MVLMPVRRTTASTSTLATSGEPGLQNDRRIALKFCRERFYFYPFSPPLMRFRQSTSELLPQARVEALYSGSREV
jgi:hypothetical protein